MSASRRFRRQVNPSFAAAHGIVVPNDGENGASNTTSRTHDEAQVVIGSNRLNEALKSARLTGKLNVSSANLSSPLPEELFDLRAGIKVNVSLDDNGDSVKSWELHTEESVTLVDLSENAIGGCLDERIGRFTFLQTLRARRCQLNDLPVSSLSNLQHLRVLDLRGNQLELLSFDSLPLSIQVVDVSENEISSLSAADNLCLDHLVRLNLSHNSLKELPSSVQFPSLQEFQFGHNAISEIPHGFLSDTLTTLEGSRNSFDEAPDLSRCTRLAILDLSHNRLAAVPRVPNSMVRLALSGNQIKTIQGLINDSNDSLSSTVEITHLLLSENQLDGMDENTTKALVNLKVLDLRNNNLNDLPPIVGSLTKINRIHLEGNPLWKLKSASPNDTEALLALLRKRGAANPNNDNGDSSGLLTSCLVGSRILNLENKQLKELPLAELQGLRQSIRDPLVIVKMGRNQLESVPTELLFLLPRLETVDASCNRLSSLPQSLDPLKNFLLRRNQLTSSAVSQCQLGLTLVQLDLSCNRLEWIPAAILNLPNLETLNLSDNYLTGVSTEESGTPKKEGILLLPRSLVHLDLSNNQIVDIRELSLSCAACCSTNIKTVLLQNNAIGHIPPSLGLLKESNLQTIDLRGNPQRAIRFSILDKSCSQILAYLYNRMDATELEQAKERVQHIADQSKKQQQQMPIIAMADVDTNQLSNDDGDTKTGSHGPLACKDAADSPVTSALKEELQQDMNALTKELQNVHLSEAKKYAVKKKLAMTKAKLIREERRLVQEKKQQEN